MKQVLLSVAALAGSFLSYAQNGFGLKAGLNIATEKEANQTYSTASKTGLYAGLFYHARLKNSFAVQPELFYSQEGVKESTAGNSGTVSIDRINIPLLAQYITKSGVYLETGPQLGILLSAKGKYTTGSFDFKQNTQGALFSWVFGAGYWFEQGFGVDARFVPALMNSNKGSVNALSIKPRLFAFGLMYKFGMKKKRPA